MKVPFLDVQTSYLELKDEIDAALARVLSSGCYILGPEVERFEDAYARYCNARHCVGVGSGMDALTLALRALEIGPGDEVIVPEVTFIATWFAVSQVGARPIGVAPAEPTLCIDPTRIEAAITPRTKAIVPVHLYGHPADLDPILSIAQRYGLSVIEDAAQAHGARYKGRPIGAHADAVTWSFYPSKNLGAFGDGGAVTTNDDAIARSIRLLHNYGSQEKYRHETLGVNSRLDPVQAAVLNVKLPRLDAWNKRRERCAHIYEESLGRTALSLPSTESWASHAWHLYVVRTPERDKLRDQLKKKGIDTGAHYPIAPQLQPPYRLPAGSRASTPGLTEVSQHQVLSLPIGPHISEETIRYVAESCKAALSEDE